MCVCVFVIQIVFFLYFRSSLLCCLTSLRSCYRKELCFDYLINEKYFHSTQFSLSAVSHEAAFSSPSLARSVILFDAIEDTAVGDEYVCSRDFFFFSTICFTPFTFKCTLGLIGEVFSKEARLLNHS